jgi:hypothetical protein
MEQHRWWTAALAGGAALVLGSLYEDADGALGQAGLIALICLFGFVTVLLTFSVLHPEAEFRAYQPWVAATAGGAAGVLATLANGVHGWALLAELLVAFALGAVAVLFTRPSPARSGAAAASPAGAATPPARPPVPVPTQLPRRQGTFRGREQQLAVLHERHRRALARQSEFEAETGPTVLLLHGMPGVGKSALALEFAHQVADSYPDGQLYANLGLAGSARSESDVLSDLLETLARETIPPTASERAEVFRSLTAGRRILLVLDAARSVPQVQQLLPNSESCTVIVTGRRDFGPALGRRSLQLLPPSDDEARKVLRVFARVDSTASPVCTARIVDLCGQLPIALRAAGELAAAGDGGLCGVAVRLREASRRLSVLETSRRTIVSGFAAEYERLVAAEKTAFRRLAQVPAETFVAWTLCPLLDVGMAEASNLMAQLSAAQLLEAGTRPDPSGLVRYRFHPLVREFARGLAAAGDAAERRESARAQARLEEAGLAVTARVLAAEDPAAASRVGLVVPGERSWLAADSPWPGRIAVLGSRWLRLEHVNLVRVVYTAAAKHRWQVCWRVAARLGDSLPNDVEHANTERAFNLGLEAAARVGEAVGQTEVGLAKAAFLVAIERYDEAFRALAQTDELLTCQQHSNGGSQLPRLACRVQRLRIEASMQMAAYGDARTAMSDAIHRVQAAGDPAESAYLAILQADLNSAVDPEQWLVELPFQAAPADEADSSWMLRVALAGAEAARRRHRWDRANDRLDSALAGFDGDARRTAAIQFRRGRQAWHRSRATAAGADRLRRAGEAVDWLAEAVVTFDRMGNALGGLRARAVLVRALVAAGRLDQADEQLEAMDTVLSNLGTRPGPARATVEARRHRAAGEVLVESGRRVSDACQLLRRAAHMFTDFDDWWSVADTEVLLGRACRADDRPLDAMAVLWSAASTFDRCGDADGRHRALDEIAETARTLGYPAAADDFGRPLTNPRPGAG